LINNANEAGRKILYYLMMVILKMLQSVTYFWVAGAIGGPMGMIGSTKLI
jgi:hypothetical protein